MRVSLLIFLFIITCGSIDAQWYRYPSISPDGKNIAFTANGDIYTVSSEGGKAIPLVKHESYDFMPVWSRDGRSVAFASNRHGNFDIFIVPARGGSAKRLTWHSADEYPYDFSPDHQVIFGSARLDATTNRQFPSEALRELYSIPAEGGRIIQLLTTPAEDARISSDGKWIIYHDRKGRENPWRKHQLSSIATDIWMCNKETGEHTRLSVSVGEDRNPVFSSDNKTIYYLSERSGSFNVFKMRAGAGDMNALGQVTFFEKHPVRFLTASTNGSLCFGYDGNIYVKKGGRQPRKMNISIPETAKISDDTTLQIKDIQELAISPSGKELAFISRGEVFAASITGDIIKQITHTPAAEGSVSFSPDGKHILYASERNNKWEMVQASFRGEKGFLNSSAVIENIFSGDKDQGSNLDKKENIQPLYSPDGTEIAYTENRTDLCILNINSGKKRTILKDIQLLGRKDNGKYFEWSPDGKWLLVQFNEPGSANDEVGVISTSGKGKLINLTESGYTDIRPRWMMDGKMIIWQSDRQGLHSYANSSTRQNDVYAFRLDSAVDWETIKQKKEKLTVYSSLLSDAFVSNDGQFLYYLSKAEKNYDLWRTNIKTKETKVWIQLNVDDAVMQYDKDKQNIYVLSGGKIIHVDMVNAKKEEVSIKGSMAINTARERASMFEHIWRKTNETFYTTGMHGADWNSLKEDYSRHLPYIHNNTDFAEMLNELLGELNVSHTAATFNNPVKNGDTTASLGAFYDNDYKGSGVKIEEVMENGPLDNQEFNVRKGTIIASVDGNIIREKNNIEEFLNRKSGKKITLRISTGGEIKEIEVKPVLLNTETDLLYRRWVKRNREETTRLSNGELGYVHLYRMNDAAYRDIYEEALGKFYNKKALVIDTRFNRGGDLAPELAMFLTGISMRQNANDRYLLGTEPGFRWTKPSVLIANEANYSDGQCFAFDFRNLNIGKLVGMPVPGSCTWMNGETLQDNSMHYSVPSLGVKTMEGKYMENNQTWPDILAENKYDEVGKGKDLQLETAVKVLLDELNNKK